MEKGKRVVVTLSIVLFLIGYAVGQLEFGDFIVQPRPGTEALDSTPPCDGRPQGTRTVVNTSAVPICYQVVGNHGAPNLVSLNEATVDPTSQSDLTYVASQKIVDGELLTNCFTYNMTEGTWRTFQLNYTTGDSFYVYCMDVQYGEIHNDDSGVDKLTFSASLSLFIAILALVL